MPPKRKEMDKSSCRVLLRVYLQVERKLIEIVDEFLAIFPRTRGAWMVINDGEQQVGKWQGHRGCWGGGWES